MRKLAILVTAAALGASLLGLHASAGNVTGNDHPCLHNTGHVYEACFAYVVNDSNWALVRYYAKAHSADPSRAGGVLEDFQYRYRGSARQLIAGRVAAWPSGENIVAVPRITIINASSSLLSNSASLTTRETWRVTANSGQVLYAENNRLHHISMSRVQGKLLHIWVVTSIS